MQADTVGCLRIQLRIRACRVLDFALGKADIFFCVCSGTVTPDEPHTFTDVRYLTYLVLRIVPITHSVISGTREGDLHQ